MTYTAAQLDNMTLANLTAVYNEFAEKPIKKFSCSLAEARARVEKVLPKPVAKKAAPKAPKGPTIGSVIVTCLLAGISPKNTLEDVLLAFPEAKTTIACVYWYASRIKRGLITAPTAE